MGSCKKSFGIGRAEALFIVAITAALWYNEKAKQNPRTESSIQFILIVCQ